MFKDRSKALFFGALIATIYVIYLICYFSGTMGDMSSAEEVGGAIATALVTPHMIVIAIGAIFGWVGFFTRKPWAALVAAILYCVGGILFIVYIIFCIPMIVLGFVGYSKQKKILNQNS